MRRGDASALALPSALRRRSGQLRVGSNVWRDCSHRRLPARRLENETASFADERLDVYEHAGKLEEDRPKRRRERVIQRSRTDNGSAVTELGRVFYHLRVFEIRVSGATAEERREEKFRGERE